MRKFLWSLFLFVHCSGFPDWNATRNREASSTLPKNRRLFITISKTTGNLGGASGADILCNNAANKPPGSGIYKAIIADSSRQACASPTCENIDQALNWVLLPNTTYYLLDGTTPVATTNSGAIFSFPLAHPVDNSGMVFTGLNPDWTTDPNASCENWTSEAAGVFGRAGNSASLDTSLLSSETIACNTQLSIICVEQ